MIAAAHTIRSMSSLQVRPGRVSFYMSVITLLVAGCAEVTVHRAHNSELLDDQRSNLIEPGGLSARTVQTLRQLDLDYLYHNRPVEALARLRVLAVDDPQPERVFALAEISYNLGRKAQEGNKPDAAFFYYLSAGFAYRYLLPNGSSSDSEDRRASTESGEDRGSKPSPARPTNLPNSILDPQFSTSGDSAFDPQFRLACDLYNTSLARFLRLTMKAGPLDPHQPMVIRTSRGTSLTLAVERQGFPWRPEEFGALMFSADYRVDGLENQHHCYGLGVPLMCERSRVPPTMSHAAFPRDLYFPVTAFLRFDGTIADLGAHARLEMFNPFADQTAMVEGRKVPLECDLTTPLAYGLSKSEAYLLQYEGFLSADKLKHKTGIYMLEPYQPGKIPVLFIHGLLSSPATWAKMYNDLEADPVIRKHFQFWGYFYPSGDPYFLTAADLRQRLVDLRTELDPQHADQALDDMICVGHSMGGLISRLMTVDSGDSFWRVVSARPLDSLKLDPTGREELRRVFYFQAEPSVRRVIFLSTPHHGSSLSRIGPARLADQVIRLPKGIIQAKYELARENPNETVFPKGKVPTSVDLLEPGSPCLELLASQPKPDGVHFHSIIGVLPPDETWINWITPVSRHGKEKSDGVVPYSSAHLDGVDSELIVPADHLEVHQHALSILEVRRILLEHLKTEDDSR
jgi:pimeloyl-ACP methyl ester carboxylesterase